MSVGECILLHCCEPLLYGTVERQTWPEFLSGELSRSALHWPTLCRGELSSLSLSPAAAAAARQEQWERWRQAAAAGRVRAVRIVSLSLVFIIFSKSLCSLHSVVVVALHSRGQLKYFPSPANVQSSPWSSGQLWERERERGKLCVYVHCPTFRPTSTLTSVLVKCSSHGPLVRLQNVCVQ